MVPKVLILTASYGSGHVMVAKALDEAFRKKGIEPVVLDLVEIGGKTEKAATKFYELLMKRGHFVWKLYHEKIMPINRGNSIRSIYKSLHKGKFFKEIEEINPDVIISTMDQASVIASLFKDTHPNVKTATVITDYVAHPIWAWDNMDCYFVPSQIAKEFLISQGVYADTISITGIPLRSQFQKLKTKKEARKILNIPEDKTIVLISTGTFNSVPIEKIIKTLSEFPDVFAIILAGKSPVADFADMLRVHGVIGKVVGYTQEMELFMVASDLYVSKAGGVTTAECLACSLPALYFNNFPGHEAGNADYVMQHGAGFITDKKGLEEKLDEILKNPTILVEMSKAAKKISLPHASEKIVKALL